MTAKFVVTAGKLKCSKKWGKKRIDRGSLPKFWEEVGSGRRRGVYVFGIKAAKGWKPLYVGQTKKQSFQKRVYQHTGNSGRFNKILKATKKGTPWLFLIGRVGRGKSSNAVIDELEHLVINYAFDRNANLDNDRKIDRPTYEVRGFAGRGKPSKEVGYLKTMLGY
jgi:hypothetical protein